MCKTRSKKTYYTDFKLRLSGNIDYYEEKNFWNGKPHESVFNYALTRRLIVAMGEAYYSQHQLTSCNLVLSNMYSGMTILMKQGLML